MQNLQLLHLAPELGLLVSSSDHHLPAQADHALDHPLDALRQVLVLLRLPLQLLLEVVELLAQLVQALLVGARLDLLVRQGSLLLNWERGKDQYPIVSSVPLVDS